MPPVSINDLLKRNSRSFYLTLRVLPRAIRHQIGLAYLLARTTDTIADTEIVSPGQRLEALDQLRERIVGLSTETLNFDELRQQQASPAEQELLEHVEKSLGALHRLKAKDLKLVREVLETITSGQELDLQRFAGATPQSIIALRDNDELDDYTFRVAGCVGKFWTALCVAHVFSVAEQREYAAAFSFEELGVRFGKGLQLVNILRDLPADLRKGRCYIPADSLATAGLTPADLLSPDNEIKFRPLYNAYLDLAETHLAAGWEYTNLIWRRHVSLRLACAWPVLIGLETLQRLRVETILDPEQRVKISRDGVRSIIVSSLLRYPFKNSWKNLAAFSSERR